MTRKPNGQFAKGNPGGPGRPSRVVEADYLRALSDACDMDSWREICEKAVADAKAGDAKARVWLAKYLCGEAKLSHSLTMMEQMARIAL